MIAVLEHIYSNTFRLLFKEHGKVVDIHEFSGVSICNGLNPFQNHSMMHFECNQWYVDYGKAELALTKMKKAIMQCPFGNEHW